MGQTHPPLIVLSGGIGSGKGTILHALTRELNLAWVPTHTTRPMRHDDDILSQRIFDTETTFLRHLARHEFIETVEIGGHRYGLRRADLQQELQSHKPAILELSVDGGIKLDRLYSDVLLLFVQAAESDRLKRITHRHMSPEEQASRLKDAHREEKLAKENYDYLVPNISNHPEKAIQAMKDIILGEFPQLAIKR
jgi:guanylate kinase